MNLVFRIQSIDVLLYEEKWINSFCGKYLKLTLKTKYIFLNKEYQENGFHFNALYSFNTFYQPKINWKFENVIDETWEKMHIFRSILNQ